MKKLSLLFLLFIFSSEVYSKNNDRKLSSELLETEQEIQNFVLNKIQSIIKKETYDEKHTEFKDLYDFIETQYRRLENELSEIEKTQDPELKRKIEGNPIAQEKRNNLFFVWADQYTAFVVPQAIFANKKKPSCDIREEIYNKRYGSLSKRDTLRKNIIIMIEDICLSYREKNLDSSKKDE